MVDAKSQKLDWPRIALCLGLSVLGLLAIPFVGTRYGDWTEAIALGIALVPMIYLAVYAIIYFNRRVSEVERLLRAVDAAQRE